MRVSTLMRSESLRLVAQRIARDLDTGTREMTTGRRDDLGAGLGARLSRPVEARIQRAQLEALEQSDAIVASRLEIGQSALSTLQKGAGTLRSALLAAKATPDHRDALVETARGFLSTLVATLGRDAAGVAVFGGRALDGAPLAAWDATRAAGPSRAIRDAFVAQFGFDQDDPAVATIDKAAMQTFLSGAFAARFAPAGWSADWSKASDATLTTTIAPGETIATTMSANDGAFRDLARATTMIADLGAGKLAGDAFDAIVDEALKALAPAMSGLTRLQTGFGAAQERLTEARESMRTLRASLEEAIGADESVDAYAAAARVNDLRTRLETTYALTARLRDLTLLRYL